MAKDSSFDVVSEVDFQELDNAVNQAVKEITQRYDFKGAVAEMELEDKKIKLLASDEYKLEVMLDILRIKMGKRGVPLRCLTPGKIEPAAKGAVRQVITVESGITKEKAKDIVAAVKAMKLKVQAQMMDDKVRVTGAKKDELQAVIQLLKQQDFGVDLQFINFR